jgi:hypothetical protein
MNGGASEAHGQKGSDFTSMRELRMMALRELRMMALRRSSYRCWTCAAPLRLRSFCVTSSDGRGTLGSDWPRNLRAVCQGCCATCGGESGRPH